MPLMACADLALDPEVVALQRMVLQETGQIFRHRADVLPQRPSAPSPRWRTGCAGSRSVGLIALDDIDEAAGMLSAWRRLRSQRAAIFGGEPPPPQRSQIEARLRRCAKLFLRGAGVMACRSTGLIA